MVKELAIRFLNHPHRFWIACGVAGLFVLVFGLPIWDDFNDSNNERADLALELNEIKASIANLETLRKRAGKDPDVESTSSMVDANRAEDLREQVLRLAHQLNCRTRRLALSDPKVRPWGKNDSPYRESSGQADVDSKFQLETRTLDLTANGTLVDLSKLVARLNYLNRFATPVNLTLQRESINDELRLDINIALYNLAPTHD